jgi:hypothetical protein
MMRGGRGAGALPLAGGRVPAGSGDATETMRDQSGTIRRNLAGHPLGWRCTPPYGSVGIQTN